ncbi:MAG: 2-oxoacid:acceptor oxidoreductase subunit alpha, partial [Gammaproteobacteria bacterium]
GDSGDGMQLIGSQFTNTSALLGNDIHTFPDFPAEIRAPAGTLPGVSGFQLSFSSKNIHTAGDKLNVLVAMNPAGLKVNLADLEDNGLLILNENGFDAKDLKKAHYAENPLETGELSQYRVFSLPITDLTLNAVKTSGISHSQGTKCKNMFALGIVFWLYTRPLDYTTQWLAHKFQKQPEIANANIAALKAGFNYALTTELFSERYTVRKAALKPGRYRQITGNEALALGCVAVATKSGRPLLLSGYPITPASAILTQLAKYTHFGIATFQAEDEIAAICACIGAAFGGSLAVTSTSGPGLDLKAEGLGLAVMTELPLVVIDVQRAGPSTGMPTKTEQADLLTAIYGRHGECPIPVLAPATPGDCFNIMIEAFRIALKYMTPVIILSDGYLANGAEPWMLPDVNTLPDLIPRFHTDPNGFTPYTRDPKTLARLWAIPGTPGLEHRLGGLEKDQKTGNISYDPINHHEMVLTRAKKIQNIANDIPEVEILGSEYGKILVVSWGGTYGTVLSAVEELQAAGQSVSLIHLRHLHPFPKNLGAVLRQFETVIVPELNLGQLCQLLRAEFLVDAKPYNKITGKPFLISEIREHIIKLL